MKDKEKTPEYQLKAVRETLHQEWVNLQKMGRALTPEEDARSMALARAVELLDEALEVLSQKFPDLAKEDE